MSCSKVNELIQDFTDGALSAGERELVQRHVDECPQCASELARMESLFARLDAMPLARTSVGFVDRVIGRLKTAGLVAESLPTAAGRAGGVVGRVRVLLATATICLIAAVVFPSTIGSLKGMVGDGALLATDAYIELQETASKADMLTRVIDGLERMLGAAKTVGTAALVLLARASELLMLPALLTMLVLTTCTYIFLRVSRRRVAEHATFSF
jgi:hypothetical protein